ncbi:MAG: hypothetical protein Q4G46_13830 [Propionibacteriaceae bacterium]|nr:hypothetical protein [Propionibacteriaceae bacterium]
MTEITVDQLLIGWSRTSNGKNVLARSPGWPSEPTRSEWVALLGDFLGSDADRHVRATGDVPWLLEFLPSAHGSILMLKVYAADSARAGEFQVHALLDPTRTLGPVHLPMLAEAGVLLRERADVTRLETLTIEVPDVLETPDPDTMALILESVHRGRPLVVRAETLEDSVAVFAELVEALPPALAVRTPARSVVTDADRAQGVGVAVAPWTDGADEVPLLDEMPVGAAYRTLAERVIAGEWALPEDPARLAGLLDLATVDPATVTADELVRGVTGPLADQWLATALDTARTRDLLLQAVTAGRLPWGAWTDELWRRWLGANRNLSKGLRASIAVDAFPRRFAAVLDALPHHAIDHTLGQLARWPDDSLDRLAEALLVSRQAAPDLLIQTLDRMAAEDVRRLVQRHWPQLGHQLGLPESVVHALKPQRGWSDWLAR